MKTSPARALGACLVLLLVWSSRAGRAEKSAPLPFAPGETLTYDVNWSVFPAGRVVAVFFGPTKNTPATYEVRTTAQSRGFVSVLYSVHDEFHSYISPGTLCSQRISKKINEGRRHKETDIQFDDSRGLAILD